MSVSKLSVQIEGRSFHVEIEDLHARPVVVIVDGERFEVTPETGSVDAFPGSATSPASAPNGNSHPLKKSDNGTSPQYNGRTRAATQTAQGTRQGDVRAPLPGTILSVAVAPGERVEIGQELCTLEAMKMKNLIRATHAGTIIEVLVSPGQTVKHNELLLRCVHHSD